MGMGAISLVVPYFEDPEGLRLSLESVRLRGGDEVIIVDDGSVVHPARRVWCGPVGPAECRIIELGENRGIAEALARGVAEVSQGSEYVARLDCGDVCSPSRFDIQRSQLDGDADLVLLGSDVEFVSAEGDLLYTLRMPRGVKAIERMMHVNCALIHPSVVFRISAYVACGGYRDLFPYAEDFDLFWRMMRYGKIENAPEVLVKCRTGDGGISTLKRRTQLHSRRRLLIAHFVPSFLAVYGIVRACVQLVVPRQATTLLRRLGCRDLMN